MKELLPDLRLRSSTKPRGLLLPRCDACGLYKSCRSPKMAALGHGRKKTLIVAGVPGDLEDRENRPLAGDARRLLEESLAELDVELDRDCWLTSVLICAVTDGSVDSRRVEHCRPNAIATAQQLRPERIVLLGSEAVQSVLGWLWRPTPGGVHRWAGYQAPDRRLNAWVCPTFDPARLLNDRKDRMLRKFWRRHLKEAFEKAGRPYRETPRPLEERVRRVYRDREAASLIDEVIRDGLPTAFDYETSHKLPYSEGSRILCCALSDKERSFGFPWTPGVLGPMRRFLTGPNKKIAHNLSFEHKWTLEKLKVSVRNWYWDGMLAEHSLDNRKGITGLKFLSYARLGYEEYDSAVEPLRKSKGAHGKNRLEELLLNELLLYCGSDALISRELTEVQCRELKIKF